VQTVELSGARGQRHRRRGLRSRAWKKAQELKRRGYIVLPDPEDPHIVAALKKGSLQGFERHSRLGMVEEAPSCPRRAASQGRAKHVFLKTGAFTPGRPGPGRQIRLQGQAGHADGRRGPAGGTGMSLLADDERMGRPLGRALEPDLSVVADRLAKKANTFSDIIFAGGITFEDQILQALARAPPYVKGVGQWPEAPWPRPWSARRSARASSRARCPVYVERFRQLDRGDLRHGPRGEAALRQKFRRASGPAPWASTATIKRLSQGLRQLMSGTASFGLSYIDRDGTSPP